EEENTEEVVAQDIPGVEQLEDTEVEDTEGKHVSKSSEGRFYSPLVKNIASEEGIDMAELDRIPGTGTEGRVTKQDILNYLETKKATQQRGSDDYETPHVSPPVSTETVYSPPPPAITLSPQDEIIEMDRM